MARLLDLKMGRLPTSNPPKPAATAAAIPDSSTFLGSGKIVSLAAACAETDADVSDDANAALRRCHNGQEGLHLRG